MKDVKLSMKIGIFDSGLGGLFILRSIVKRLPRYDYIYLGDTKRVPYGNRSSSVVYGFLEEAVSYLFKRGCKLVIVACNTASAEALRKIQRQFLPKRYPDRRVLGVIIPSVEAVAAKSDVKRAGVLATYGTVKSNSYVREIKKLRKDIKIFQQAAPLLVPLVENGEFHLTKSVASSYLQSLKKAKIDALLLGCTHYPILKNTFRALAGKKISIISQDEIVPGKLESYLARHPEIKNTLGTNRRRELLATDVTSQLKKMAIIWFGKSAKLKLVSISKSTK